MKNKMPTPQGGAIDRSGGLWKEGSKEHQEGSQNCKGTGYREERCEAVAAPVLCHPCPLSRDFSTSGRTGVCGVRSKEQEKQIVKT